MCQENFLTIYKRFAGYPDSAVHAFMEDQEKRSSKGKVLVVSVKYQDGSFDDEYHVFHPATKKVPYKTADGELWEANFETSKWDGDWLFDFKPMSKSELKKALADYITGPAPLSIDLIEKDA